MHASMHACMHVCKCVYMCIYIYIGMCMCVYIYMCVCVCVSSMHKTMSTVFELMDVLIYVGRPELIPSGSTIGKKDIPQTFDIIKREAFRTDT